MNTDEAKSAKLQSSAWPGPRATPPHCGRRVSNVRYGDAERHDAPGAGGFVLTLQHVADDVGDDLGDTLEVEDVDMTIGAHRDEHEVGLDHAWGQVEVRGGRVLTCRRSVGQHGQVGVGAPGIGGDADDVQQHAGDVRRVGHDIGLGRVDAVDAADLQVDGLLGGQCALWQAGRCRRGCRGCARATTGSTATRRRSPRCRV